MTFPTATSRRNLAAALEAAQQTADTLKRVCLDANTAMAAGSVTASYVLQTLDIMRQAKATFAQVSALPGLATFAQDQLGQSVTSDFTAMTSALDNGISWVVTNLPKAAGYLQIHSINADGSRTERTFSTAETGGFRTTLQAIIATIG